MQIYVKYFPLTFLFFLQKNLLFAVIFVIFIFNITFSILFFILFFGKTHHFRLFFSFFCKKYSFYSFFTILRNFVLFLLYFLKIFAIFSGKSFPFCTNLKTKEFNSGIIHHLWNCSGKFFHLPREHSPLKAGKIHHLLYNI